MVCERGGARAMNGRKSVDRDSCFVIVKQNRENPHVLRPRSAAPLPLSPTRSCLTRICADFRRFGGVFTTPRRSQGGQENNGELTASTNCLLKTKMSGQKESHGILPRFENSRNVEMRLLQLCRDLDDLLQSLQERFHFRPVLQPVPRKQR
jgi:hypothetical protein